MKKRKQGVLIILLCIFGVLIVFSGYFYVQIRRQAGAIDDVFYSYCKKAVDNLSLPASSAQSYLADKYGKPFPKDSHTSFQLDFETYRASWDEYIDVPEDPNPQVIDPDRKKAVDDLFAKKDAIVTEIRNTIGDPFNKNNVVVVYTGDFLGNTALNPEGAENASARYRPDDNLIILTDASIDSLIHETTHAFNDGGLPIESFEEGITESIERIVSAKISSGVVDLSATNTEKNRDILSSMAGIFRTIDNSYLVDDRYNQSAIKMYERYSVNPNFYKIYRSKLLADSFTKEMLLSDPVKIMAQAIGYTACAEVTDGGDKNRLNNLIAKENAILKSAEDEIYTLSDQINKPDGSIVPIIDLQHSGVFNIRPVSRIYNDIRADFDSVSGSGGVTFMSTYKRTNLLDILMNLYRKTSGDNSESIKIKTTLADFFQNTSIEEYGSLQSIGYLLEERVDSAIVTISDSKKNELYRKAFKATDRFIPPDGDNSGWGTPGTDTDFCPWCPTINSKEIGDGSVIGRGQSVSTLGEDGYITMFSKKKIIDIVHKKIPEYKGDILLTITSKKGVIRAERDDECVSWPGGKVCWPDKIKVVPESIRNSTYKTFSLIKKANLTWDLIEKSSSLESIAPKATLGN